MTLPPPENSPEVDQAERTNRRLLRTIAVAVGLVAIGVAFTLILRFGDAAKQSTIKHSLNIVLLSSERADCRTAYNSDRGAVLERAGEIERQNVAAFGGYLLSQGVTTAELAANKKALDAANKAAAALPSLNDMVDHGYTLNGVHHPPCPVVK